MCHLFVHTHASTNTHTDQRRAEATAHCPVDWYVNETYTMLRLHWSDFQPRSSPGWQQDKEPKLLLSGSKLSFLLSSFSSLTQTQMYVLVETHGAQLKVSVASSVLIRKGLTYGTVKSLNIVKVSKWKKRNVAWVKFGFSASIFTTWQQNYGFYFLHLYFHASFLILLVCMIKMTPRPTGDMLLKAK